MSEKDRMLAGELYLFEGDAELMEMGMRARRLTRLYNATREDEDQRRRELLEELLGAVGAGSRIEPPLHCDYGCNLHVGERFFRELRVDRSRRLPYLHWRRRDGGAAREPVRRDAPP